MASDNSDKTAMIGLDQETINRELKKAQESPDCFVLIRGTPQGHSYFMEKDEMIIGRDASADISITDPLISRKHAKITREGTTVKIEDLGSSNGSDINGKKLVAGTPTTLSKEDIIKLGNSMLKYLPAGHIEIITYGNLDRQKNTDAMTKCFNKGYFLEAIEAEVKRAKALASPITLLFFDLDHFKKVNDTYGHEAGDHVLKEFANIVRNSGTYKQKDIFARYGGEEFCLLMPGTTSAEAAPIAETIRGMVHMYSFMYEGKRIPVTTSMGVSELKGDTETAQDLIKAADKALYQSKQGGRNRVTVA
jgi:diguanylate cyclase (GGDEF)-like protein